MKLLQEITLKYATVQWYEGLVRLEISGGVVIGHEKARELNDAIGVLSRGRQILLLIVADEVTQFNKYALAFSASKEGLKFTLAGALVVKSMAQRITANFYLSVNRPKRPSRIFNSEKEAVKWLQSVESNFIPA